MNIGNYNPYGIFSPKSDRKSRSFNVIVIADQSTQTNTWYGNPLRKLIARPKFSRVLTEARTIPSPSFLSRLFDRQDGDQNQFTCTQRLESQNSIAAVEPSFMQNSDWTWNYSDSIQNEETRAEKLIVGFIVMLIVCLTLPFSIFILCTIVQEYECVVIFRFGRLKTLSTVGPGLVFIVPFLDVYRKIDLRTCSFTLPPQQVITADFMNIKVDAVIFYVVEDAILAVSNVENYGASTQMLAAAVLRSTLSNTTLANILSERCELVEKIQSNLSELARTWGVFVERFEIKDLKLPEDMMKAMDQEIETRQEAKARVIMSDCEKETARILKKAADIIEQNPAAIKLRYLQTLKLLTKDRPSVLMFPIPIEL